MEIRYSQRGDIQILAPIGEWDLCNAQILGKCLELLDHEATPEAEVDMTRVEFLDGAAIRKLLDAARKWFEATGKKLVLRGVNNRNKRTLRIVRADPWFDFQEQDTNQTVN